MLHSEVLAAEQLGIGYLMGIRTLMHPNIIKFFGLNTETFFDLICSNVGETSITFQTGLNYLDYVLDGKAITTILTHKF